MDVSSLIMLDDEGRRCFACNACKRVRAHANVCQCNNCGSFLKACIDCWTGKMHERVGEVLSSNILTGRHVINKRKWHSSHRARSRSALQQFRLQVFTLLAALRCPLAFSGFCRCPLYWGARKCLHVMLSSTQLALASVHRGDSCFVLPFGAPQCRAGGPATWMLLLTAVGCGPR